MDALAGCRSFHPAIKTCRLGLRPGSRIDSKSNGFGIRDLLFFIAEVLTEKGTVMAGRLLFPLKRLFSLPERRRVPVVIEMNQHSGSARIPVRATLASQSERVTFLSRTELDRASRASAAGLGCIRGTSFAFLFEAGAALVVYGICQLWHLFRLAR